MIGYAHCLKQGTSVCTIDNSASGVIVGVSHVGTAPGVGAVYVIRLDSRSSEQWKQYPYECATIPRCLLRICGGCRLVAAYEGSVQFFDEGQGTPMVFTATGIQRKLYEPYTISFSFKDDDNDVFDVIVEMKDGLWSGSYSMTDAGTKRPLYHSSLYHVVVEDRQGVLILNATMEEAESPQHLTLRAKCVWERDEDEDDAITDKSLVAVR